MFADEAASIAEVAADEAAMADDVDVSGVVMTVVEVDGVDVVAGGVIVVVDSSFLLQAAKERAAARVTIRTAVFIFLLGGFKVRTITGNCGNPSVEEPHRLKTRNTSVSSA